MSFLLDTNILSTDLRRPTALAHRFLQYSGRLYTATICLAELYVWAFARSDPSPMLASIDRLLEYEVSVVDFDQECAKRFGRLRATLRGRGIAVNTTDLMIACVALEYDFTMVTHNTADFRNIPDLRLNDWLAP